MSFTIVRGWQLSQEWNEWGEGGYLEPDELNKYGYLEAVREALIENGEFPW